MAEIFIFCFPIFFPNMSGISVSGQGIINHYFNPMILQRIIPYFLLPQTCCDGVLYDNKAGYECCGTAYIPQRVSASHLCCGGKFHRPLRNHQCCGGRWVNVSWKYIKPQLLNYVYLFQSRAGSVDHSK